MQLLGTIELEGLDTAIDRALDQARRFALTRAFDELRSRVAEQFLTQGTAYSTRWSERKAKTQTNRPLLVQTGRLLASLIDQNHPEHIEQILAGEGATLVGIFGTAVPYAHPLQFGTRYMPARPILTERMLSF